MDSLTRLLKIDQPQANQFPGPQPATVSRVDGTDLYVEVTAIPGLEVGPCKWSRTAVHAHSDPQGGSTGSTSLAAPPAGTGCLVLFVGAGIENPWVVGWDGWPA